MRSEATVKALQKCRLEECLRSHLEQGVNQNWTSEICHVTLGHCIQCKQCQW